MKQSVWLIFGALCLLSSTAWIATPLGSTSTLPPLERQGLLYALLGLIALSTFALRPESQRKIEESKSIYPWPELALTGIAFFGLPAIALEFATGALPETSRILPFTLTPIVVAVALTASQSDNVAEKGARRTLIPSLTGIAGLLLLLPLNFSNSARSQIMLAVICAAVILAALAGLWLFRMLQGISPLKAAAIICLSNATLLLTLSAISGSLVWTRSDLASLASPSSLVNLIEIPLLLWLAREMPPMRFAARYLVIPLLTVLEAYIVMHPPMTPRTIAGAILLSAGALTLLLLKPTEEDEVLSLR
jgi:drug/metabolite transporter (DMT)-like permease